jgi:ABC-type Fe3+-hydroxamate transport system substrate-binding protein
MRTFSRLAVTAASVLALSALSGNVGLTASAQPPASSTTAAEPDDTTVDADSDEAQTEESPDAAPAAGGGSGTGVPFAPSVAPADVVAPTGATPAAISPDTAPLGSSGGGGTGGNGRPTQDPVKDG